MIVANPLLLAALDYAARGWPVIPLCWPDTQGECACGWGHEAKEAGKAPRTSHGVNDATTNATVLQAWWDQFPMGNIGVALSPAGLVDIAPDSLEWLDRFKGFGLPDTATFESGGGEGHTHYLYQRPVDCPTGRKCHSGQYDLLSDGYCIMPPSMHHSGRWYRWLEWPERWPDGLPQLPAWALPYLASAPGGIGSVGGVAAPDGAPAAAATANAPPGGRRAQWTNKQPPVHLSTQGMAFWRGEKSKLTAEGNIDRSATLYIIGLQLAEAGATQQTITEALADRDITLGFRKYSERPADLEYWRVANKVYAVVAETAGHWDDPTTLEDTSEGAARPFELVARTAFDLSTLTPAAANWLVEGYVARESVTLLSGKPKSSGKTTFCMLMIAALLKGVPFLGLPTSYSKVLFLTEERPTTFREVQARTGLLEATDLLVASWVDLQKGLLWETIMQAAVAKALEFDASLLVIDTLAQWAGLKGDAENSSGAVLEAMKPLHLAASANLAVLICDHDRKSGGAVGESNRGSGAKVGSVDIVLDLQRTAGGEEVATRREVHSISRFDLTPAKLVIDLRDGVYVPLGQSVQVALMDAIEFVLGLLGSGGQIGYTEEGLIKGADDRHHRTVIREALAVLIDRNQVGRTGLGRRGSPYQYLLLPEP